ncbi:MAG: helix-turn-helix domain-containing protein, partial [Candidatus Omnitrophica bacterium]|nr:helix-turn-helix domain-containing protein [Candidatus Omnitrophota bacterium]
MSDYQPKKSPSQWISIQEATRHAPYSQEYLSLLARRGKIFAKKIGRNWYTTHEALERYISEQALLSPISKQFSSTVELASAPSNLLEEFKRLNPQAFPKDTKPEVNQESGSKKQETEPALSAPVIPLVVVPVIPEIKPDNAVLGKPSNTTPTNFSSDEKSGQRQVGEDILGKLDRLSDSLETFASSVTASIRPPEKEIITRVNQSVPLDPEVEEFIQERKNSSIHRFKHFDRFAKSTARSPARLMTIMVTAIVLLFVLVGGFSFGQVDAVAQKIKKALTDATTIGGHFAGTHANEVLVLGKDGNISIYGHIETEGQFRSRAPDGVAPIVVDSMTKVENLNADYIDNLSSQDFTLAFVTKNGNLTYEDVHLMGNVEVGKLLKVGGDALIGKTLTVSGATKLLDSLTVYGKLGVLSDAVFGKDVTLTNGNLIIEKGTIKISNMTLVKNLNAEYLDGVKKGEINLQFVTTNGNTTTNTITVGGLTSTGTITSYGPGFFNSSIWSPFGSFGDLGVGKSASFGDSKNPSNSKFEVYSSKFTLDANGNATIAGRTTTGPLLVSGSVLSNLIPSGSFDLGSAGNPWSNLYVVDGNFS